MKTISMKVSTWNTLVPIALYAASIILYLQPLTDLHHYEKTHQFDLIRNPQAVLDEMYLLPYGDNNDVKIDPKLRTPIKHIFTHDYWGRDMNAPSSHKSYRPITVLSLRLGYHIADMIRMNGLFVQRVLNVILHSVLVQMLGRLYQSLFNTHKIRENRVLKVGFEGSTLASLLFMLHPTHIESVVNIANRAHLLSLVFVMASLDLSLNAIVAGFIYAMGLLSCETSIFLFPAIILTWIYIDLYGDHTIELSGGSGGGVNQNHPKFLSCVRERWCRLGLFFLVTSAYVLMRYYLDWIDIPHGLIRRAENPFYEFSGLHRVLNYSYIGSIHMIKSIGMGFFDLVGFSHEYGFDCVTEIKSLQDCRLLYPFIVVALVFALISISSGTQSGVLEDGSKPPTNKRWLFLLMIGAWMASLFPICGIIRVGTFIADRIVISSSVASAILWARVLHSFLHQAKYYRKMHFFAFSVSAIFLWMKVQRRSIEWMCPVSLLRGSLRACPRSAKSHLEISKVYTSGLFGLRKDLKKSTHHLKKVEEIDPDFCDVHYQLAQVYIQHQDIANFEQRITKGVLCPFTMNASYSLFQQYWSHVLNGPQIDKGAKMRYGIQIKIIQDAIAKEKDSEERDNAEAGQDSHEENEGARHRNVDLSEL